MKFLRILKNLRFLLAFFILLLLFLISGTLKTNKIECFSQFGACSDKLSDELKVFEGKNLPDSKKGIEKTLKNNFTVGSYGLSYKLPSSYEVRVVEKKPKFAIETSKSDEELVLVDKDGISISSSGNSELPKLVINGNPPEPGKVIDKKILFALNMLYDTYTSYQVKVGSLKDDSLVIELPGGVRVIFPLEGDREVLSGSLILLYNQITRKDGSEIVKTGANIDTIDLRFKNPILKSH